MRGEARRVVRALLDTAAFYDGCLPELFSGYERSGAEPPVVRANLGVPAGLGGWDAALCCARCSSSNRTSAGRACARTRVTACQWAEGLLLDGVHAHGRRWRVRVRGGAAVVDLIS